MNALEAASLVMIPSGYENGTLGSLKPTDGTGDFTFSRGSDISATRVNEDGYIEKGYENLLLQSNSFDTTWALTPQLSVSGNETGYDGTNDAWLLEKEANSYRRIYQNITLSGVWTFSVYAKANTLNRIDLRDGSFNGTGFNLSDGSIISSTNVVDSSIEIVNGTTDWYRCSVTFSASSSQVMISCGWADLISGSIYIQDAMLNQGMVSYPYVETTTAPVAGGILEDMPRLDYTDSSCPSLKLEPQRTNLISHSEYPEGNQFFNNLNPDYNATTSPEGIQNATRITATGTGAHQYGSYPVVSSGVGVVGSVFVKADATEYVQLFFGGGPPSGLPYANFFIGENPSIEREVDLTASIEDYGNGWLRLIIKQTTDASGGITFAVMPIPNGTTNRAASYTANGESIFTYGLQLEQDATYPTSYIPTYGTSQTRLEDLATDAGDASTFNDSEGVLYAELSFTNDNSFKSLSLNSGSSTNRVMLYSSNPAFIGVNIRNTLGNQFNGNFAIDSTINHKIAVKYKENDFALWIDGQERLSDLSGTTFPPSTLTQLDFDDANGNSPFNGVLKQIIVFPTVLSDDECIELTTI